MSEEVAGKPSVTWPEATTSSLTPRSDSGGLAAYGFELTGNVCRATYDPVTLDSSYGCTTTREDGTVDWTSTYGFTVASATVNQLEGAVFDGGPTGVFVVSDEEVAPLDDLAAGTLGGSEPVPLDVGMAAIDARWSEFDGGVMPPDTLAIGAVILAVALGVAGAIAWARRRSGHPAAADATQ